MKVLKKEKLRHHKQVELVKAEQHILVSTQNPHVVSLFYSFHTKQYLYLVMEFLVGGDLLSLLSSMGCLDEYVVVRYMAEVILALEYLHSSGIVHRDLKPDNILIGADGHIKLTDFGLAAYGIGTVQHKTLEKVERGAEDSLWKNPGILGTPDYISPEQLIGDEPTFASDWWAFGVVVFEMLTGAPPFNAPTKEAVFQNISTADIPWPEDDDSLSPEARDLIERLLVVDVHKRLGYRHGAGELKAHPFFRTIEWATLLHTDPPFVPEVSSDTDTMYFQERVERYNSLFDFDEDLGVKPQAAGAAKKGSGHTISFDDATFVQFSFTNLQNLEHLTLQQLQKKKAEYLRQIRAEGHSTASK